MFKLLKQSAVIRESLIKVINKSGKTKKEIAKQVNVSQQSLSDWTTPHNTKPVTLENAQALTDHFRDSDFTLHVIHKFFGLFKSIDGDVYRRDPSSLFIGQSKKLNCINESLVNLTLVGRRILMQWPKKLF